MKGIFRPSSPAIVLLILAAIAGCGEEKGAPALRLAFETEPSTLDPAFAVDYSSGMAASLVHSGLVRFDPEGGIIPDLAREWSVSPGGMEYTFVLSTAEFSGGLPVTAGDVVRSFRRLVDPATASPRWWVLEPVEGAFRARATGDTGLLAVEAIDDSTVVIVLERPAAHFLSLLAMPAACITGPEAGGMGDDYGRAPDGSGPWTLESWISGERMVLGRRDRAGGRRKGVERMVIRMLPEPMTRIAEFEVGNLDILEIPAAELDRWRIAAPRLLSRPELRVVYIGLNNTRPPFDDLRVRRAVNMAVDVEAVIAHVLFGAAGRIAGVVPEGLREGPPLAAPYRYDPPRARAQLADAGYADGFEIELWQRDNPEAGRVLESVQAYLAEVGIEARIVTREWSAFKQAVQMGTPDAFYLDWFADYPDPGNFLAPLFHSENRGGGGNRTGYTNGEVDSLLDAASAVLSPERRWDMLARAERIVYEDAPWLFLWFPVRYEAVSPRLKGYTMPLIFNGQQYTGVTIR